MTSRMDWLDRIRFVQNDGHIPIIAEIKPSSPSAGDLIGNRRIADIVRAYTQGGAACISVVTGRWFGGERSLLEQVALETSLPLLRKDLIVNQDQIRESRDMGANAILLTKKILSQRHMDKMIDLCLTLNVRPFIEVSSQTELEDITASREMIVALTNRDIGQKEQDTDSGLKSLAFLPEMKMDVGALVSASGIRTPDDANALYQAGFDGLLVGTSLLQADNPEIAVRSLCVRNNTPSLTR